MSSVELGRMLQTFEEYMPTKHRELLQDARRNSVRGFVLQLRERGVEQAETLL